jgi:adenylosuccinate synthase
MDLECDDYKGFLTGKGNFRNDIAVTVPYKGTRPTEKPVHLQALRDHLVKDWEFVVTEGIEADDAVGIAAYALDEDESIMVHIDKDLNQFRGHHYNYRKKEKYYVSEFAGWHSFYLQILTGDRVDNIEGLKGIGPAYMDKTGRNGLRVGDLLDKNFTTQYIKLRMKHQRMLDSFGFNEDIAEWEEEFFEAIEFLKTLKIVNGEYFINEKIREGKKVLAEGAQGSMLDVDFGTFPFVTSSNTISAGVCTGLGIAPQKIKEVIGVTKAYCTRVGSGPFPTELHDETGERLRKIGNEFGATTGRPRRCGWIDLVALDFACMINGVTQVVMTKADVLDAFEELSVCTSYKVNGKEQRAVPYQMNKVPIEPQYQQFEGWKTDVTRMKSHDELPTAMKEYIHFINNYLGVNVSYISNGPEREQIIKA